MNGMAKKNYLDSKGNKILRSYGEVEGFVDRVDRKLYYVAFPSMGQQIFEFPRKLAIDKLSIDDRIACYAIAPISGEPELRLRRVASAKNERRAVRARIRDMRGDYFRLRKKELADLLNDE